jgi:hypothetical protein
VEVLTSDTLIAFAARAGLTAGAAANGAPHGADEGIVAAAPVVPSEAPKLSPTRAPAPLTAAEERGLRPKDRFKECAECPEMVWEQAGTYATWLSGKTGKEYRLLTEAEWEYVARAGNTKRYAFGNTITERQAKFSADESWRVPFAFRPFTWDDAEVGSFPPNAWGVHDMHGNVWEWCSDVQLKDGYYYNMLRGGSWNSPPDDLRSARRRWELPVKDDRDVGFRVARTL